ncbi:MAG: DNA polymerase I [Rhodospirillaceae bacterium]|jgi:DNA polymerase I|nr:DNA polymerase I [Rhodospirillaceae bacterium]MBT4751038.1 DNA polymerase I [Rhodospirillaceae bacterium]MBT5841056.1 DNA polymerase I [Rhodospirillaceae bacterium]MBT6859003.1 DNA polymerase I [Rhodospirillaceae bacterium]MBT7030551.1 DNA polymerase I [Rhodospirillaceae bacterium]
MQHVFLIDGSGFIFRAFYGIKADMSRADGTPTNAVYGFTQMLLKMVDDTDADYIAVVFDRARKTFRSDIYPEYKAHRPPPPDELIPQFDLVREATQAMNIAMVDMDGFEADDLIATYARQAVAVGADVTVVSSDKDLMQLVGPKVKMFDAMKNKEIGPDQVREKFGVGPDRVIDVQALAGDSSDNVPGVQGVGIKTAAQLVEEYGDLDGILARAEEIKQPKRRQVLIDQADMARVSRELVTLRDDVPVEVPLENFKTREIDPEKLLGFLQQQEFKSLIARMESRFGIEAPAPAAPAAPTSAPSDEPAAEDAPAASFSGETEYELVQDKARLQAWIDEATSVGVLAVDTETTSLNAMRAELVGISLSIEPGKACYIPVAHSEPEVQASLDLGGDSGGGSKSAIKQIKRDEAIKMLKPLLEDAGVLKIGHNMKYDAKIFAHYGIEVAPIDDTMLLSYVLEGGLHGHGMDDLAELHLGHQTIKFKDVAGTGKAQVTFDKVPLDTALDYAAEDADITLRLYRMLKPRLAREHMVSIYEVMERPLVGVLKQMESNGICVDAKMLKSLSADFANRLGDLAVDIHKLAGREFNIASPKQLGEILFDEMGLEGAKKTKTGAYGTGADVLETLAAEGHDLPARVLEWRQLAKLKSTYTDSLVEDINPATGRVHTNYGQAIASTGRLSSNDPNLQNIPVRSEEGRKIRQAFVAADGHVLLSADYSQIELRLLAHVAKIDVLIDAFKSGEDIHALTASQVFGVPIDGMDPMVRRQAKAINFGIIYGISAFGLARQLSIGRGEASDYIKAYFQRYPGIRDYMDRTKEDARENGFVTTLYGRKCHTPGIANTNSAHRSFAERAAINAPIQGGAADIIKRAMIKLPGALDGAGLNALMLLQVHDELIFEVPEAELDTTKGLVKEVMESVAHLDVPLIVDTGHGANWDEAH